jgi:hypothetical protein
VDELEKDTVTGADPDTDDDGFTDSENDAVWENDAVTVNEGDGLATTASDCVAVVD